MYAILILGNGCLGSRNRHDPSLHLIQILIYCTFETNSIKEELKWLFVTLQNDVQSYYWAQSWSQWRLRGFAFVCKGSRVRPLNFTGRMSWMFHAKSLGNRCLSACAQWSNEAKGSTNNCKEQSLRPTATHREGAGSMEIIAGWEICILVFSEAATADTVQMLYLQSVPS